MKVLKFGGTSVGTPESLAFVKKIVESLDEPAVVVVSALGGITDKLIATARLAADSDPAYKSNMREIRERHYSVINSVTLPGKAPETLGVVEPLLNELSSLYDGIALIGSLPAKILDQIVSYGERISSVIVSRMIEGASHLDSLEFIKTERWFNRHIADTPLTDRLIKEAFTNLGKNGTAVCGGFISTDRDTGVTTNLGRGGSDYTAALIAAALDAKCLEIWTDVDGFMTADPRIIPSAEVIDSLSFVESMELCSFGAKVVYPPTIYPVFHKNIPIRILNTFRPHLSGTWITDRQTSSHTDNPSVKGVTSMTNVSLIEMKVEVVENIPEINSRTFNSLAKNGISVLLVSQQSSGSKFSFAVATADLSRAISSLQTEFAPDLEEGSMNDFTSESEMAIIAAVGEGIGGISAIGPRIRHTFQRAGITVKASSHGSSAASQVCVIREERVKEALQLIHEMFFGRMESDI